MRFFLNAGNREDFGGLWRGLMCNMPDLETTTGLRMRLYSVRLGTPHPPIGTFSLWEKAKRLTAFSKHLLLP